MKTGDKFIWDSGYGFEVCLYVEPAAPEECVVRFQTGDHNGKLGLVSVNELTEYSKNAELKFKKKYK